MTLHFGRHRLTIRRGILWTMILLSALVAFELFNFSTTEYALTSLFGPHDTLGLASWATVLAVAFCGIDFAGLSRLFTAAREWRHEPRGVWFLTAAWVLGAAMNAVMTWWAVATALSQNPVLGNELVTRQQILHSVPLFVAGLVWLTRVLLIGSLAWLGDQRSTQPGRVTNEAASRPARQRSSRMPAQAVGNRASTVHRVNAGHQQPAPANRQGMPIGAYGYRMAVEDESYVDLD
ncbi:MAG: hypothetical protein Kow0077_32920 [Anaerolineae bacterium]